MGLDNTVTDIKGVGQEMAKKLAAIGIQSVADLIHNYPRRYDDFSQVSPIRSLKPGPVTVQAVIKQASGRYARRGLHITEAVASDDTGSVRLIWFNQPYRSQALKSKTSYYISGEFALRANRLSITNPSIELVSDFPVSTARIVPVYREASGIKSAQLRRFLSQVVPFINELQETLPVWVIKRNRLMSRAEAVMNIHFPESGLQLNEAKHRMGFEEVFSLTLAALMNKQELLRQKVVPIPFKVELAKQFVEHLPFKLTDDQRRVTWQIYQDMQSDIPMNRLVEGDVGSGKTVVAVMAALMAMEQKYLVALMAPTELVARQHAESIKALLEPLGYSDQIELIVGSLKPSQKTAVQKRLDAADIKLIVGTHALIQSAVKLDNLGLVIIDEQHRFGVEQRKALQAKAGHAVHVLNMTATPIPRTLALTLYGELDISIISKKPAGRPPTITKLISPNSHTQLYADVEKQLLAGHQVFVVCPVISKQDDVYMSQSENVPDTEKPAEQVYDELRLGVFKHRRVGLLHGKMKSTQKEDIMQQFVDHKLDILVATTVVEVGVNVPNATVMIIENAERFGLAQIHQLRGRVGRDQQQAYCYLLLSDSSQPSRRLRALESTNDGFALAEMDLEIRGPGAIYGLMQHGQLDLRFAQLSDTRLIAAARTSAQHFLDNNDKLKDYPSLARRVAKLQSITNLN